MSATDKDKAWIEAQTQRETAHGELELATQALQYAQQLWQTQASEENAAAYLQARKAHKAAEDAYRLAFSAAEAADKALFAIEPVKDGLAKHS